MSSPPALERLWTYRVPEAHPQAIEAEVAHMLREGIIEPSNCHWSSPVIIVPKSNSSLSLCNDFWKLNPISVWQLPSAQSGQPHWVPTGSLLHLHPRSKKGYWQVALTPLQNPRQCSVPLPATGSTRFSPLGTNGLMDNVLWPHKQYAAAYLDDIVINPHHLDRLCMWHEVLLELRQTRPTGNSKKYHLGLTLV